MNTRCQLSCLLLNLMLALPLIAQDSSRVLFRADREVDPGLLHTTDASITRLEDALEITTGHQAPWPGIQLLAPSGRWDLSPFWYLEVELSNPGDSPVRVFCRVDNPGADGTHDCVTENVSLPPHQSERLIVPFQPTPWQLSRPLDLIGMRGSPGATAIDPANVNQLLFFLNKPDQPHTFRVSHVTAGGQRKPLDADTFIPFIDEFGQFSHDDWPGKTHSLSEMKANPESLDLQAHPGPENRSRFGGWTAGPRLEETGFFRVAQVQGKWWLVDPEGYLFWSHGIDCVHPSAPTPISDRESYFAALPEADSPLAQFYGTGSWAPHGYYQDHTPYRTYDFHRANLFRIYGPDYVDAFNALTHRRLKSWGLNTIANWSDRQLCRMRQTAYTATVNFTAPVIEGSTGYWGKFFDVFDPAFRDNCRNQLRDLDSASDPWCIGYFVHNEIAWGDDLSLALASLASPSNQPAKQAFIADLRQRYTTIDTLNSAWKTHHTDWNALAQSTTPPDRETAAEDLAAFYDKIADSYFRTIDEELDRAAPGHLYLGCRFAWDNDRAVRAAARYCDVVSFNKYAPHVADLQLPDGIDKPVVIGEFHFGALDRGMFHTGLQSARSQQDRADKYTAYVQSALRHPAIVGTHWFQYKDQPTTGRGDGENYQIGFVDVGNRPHPEIVAAARQIGRTLYPSRLGAAPKSD